MKEVAEDLAPKVKTLQVSLEIVKEFHDVEDLYSIALTHNLNTNIIRSLPNQLQSSFNDQFVGFRGQSSANVRAPAMFLFLSRYMYKLEKNYRANPTLIDVNFLPLQVGIKPVQYEAPG